jgi:hypothetical protein
MLGGLTMMFGSVLIVLRCLFMMLVNLELCHSVLPNIGCKKRHSPKIQLRRQIVYELMSCPGV